MMNPHMTRFEFEEWAEKEIAKLREINAELLAACESILHAWNLDEAELSMRLVGTLKAVIAKARQNLQDSPGEAIG